MNRKPTRIWGALLCACILCIISACAPKPSFMGVFPHEMRTLDPQTINFDSVGAKVWNFTQTPEDVWDACLDVCIKFNGGFGKIQHQQNSSHILLASRRVPVSRYKEIKPGQKRIPDKTYQTWVTLAIKVETNQEDALKQDTLVKIVDIQEAGLKLNYEDILPRLSDPEPDKKTPEEMRAEAVITVLAQFYYELQQKLNGPEQWKEKFHTPTTS